MLQKGSLAYDHEKGGMTFKWDNNEASLIWLAAEQSDKPIELVVSQIEYSNSLEWQEQRMLQCSHKSMGGKMDYQKKHQWERKVPSKKTGCQCHLMVKHYPQMDLILRKYQEEYNHLLSDDNLQFLRLSGKIRNLVMDMVYIGIDSKAIVSHSGAIHSQANGYCIGKMKHICNSCTQTDQDYYITMCDINRYHCIMEDEEIQLDDNNVISLCLWVL